MNLKKWVGSDKFSQFMDDYNTNLDEIGGGVDDINMELEVIDEAMKKIECGHKSMTVGANVTGTSQVVFSSPFDDIPAINLTLQYRWPNDQLAPTIYSPSSSDFYIQVHNKTGSSLTLTVHWTAIEI